MGKYFCSDCVKSIRFYSNAISPNYHCPENLDGIFVLAHYDGIIRQAIKQVKYRGQYAIFKELAPLIKPSFQFDYLVPVPLFSSRYQKRGFNQSEKLAKYLDFPVFNCLKRTRDTKPQFDLKREDRLKNVQNAFALKQKLPAGNFCLIDDVATTGATLSECAKVLKKAGASKIYAICIARGN